MLCSHWTLLIVTVPLMRGEDISLPSFLRDIAKAKYIPELAYYGLHLLCSPFHGTEDKVQVKQNFTILTAPWKRSACFFPSPHAIFTCIVSTFDFSFPLCAIFARSELKCWVFFFFHPSPYSLWLLCCCTCVQWIPCSADSYDKWIENKGELQCHWVSESQRGEFQVAACAWNVVIPC